MWRNECPDHPDIARAMREGDPEGAPVYCPVCGAEFETAYEDAEGNIVGCDECLRTKPDITGQEWWIPVVEDDKGQKTQVYELKKKLMRERKNIIIQEV